MKRNRLYPKSVGKDGCVTVTLLLPPTFLRHRERFAYLKHEDVTNAEVIQK